MDAAMVARSGRIVLLFLIGSITFSGILFRYFAPAELYAQIIAGWPLTKEAPSA